MKRLFMTIFIATFLIGCATIGTRIEQDKIEQIKEGVTTKEEVIALMGQPPIQTLTSDGETIMTYMFTKAKIRATSFIPVVGMFVSGADTEQAMFQIIINKDNVVEKYLFNKSKMPINTGILNTE